MTATPISTVLQSAPGTIIAGMKGIVKTVSERYVGTTPASPGQPGRNWSLQTVIVQDDSGEIAVQVANHDEVGQDKMGQNIYLLAHQKATGGLTGVKLDVEDGNKILRVSTSGELVWAEPASQLAGGRTVAQPAVTDATSPRPVTALPPAPISTGAGPVTATQPKARLPIPDAASQQPTGFPKGDRAGWNPIIEVVGAYEELYWLCLSQVLNNSVTDAAKMTYGMNPAHICAATDAVFKAVLATRPSLPLEEVKWPLTKFGEVSQGSMSLLPDNQNKNALKRKEPYGILE